MANNVNKATDLPNPPGFKQGQALHLACTVVLLAGLTLIWRTLGRPYPVAFWCAALVPVLHQVFVWVAWRAELNAKAISKTIGFSGYLAVFFLLFGARFATLAVLGYLDRGSLGWAPGIVAAVTGVLLIPGLYTMYSVHRYFGMARAAGADHFDARYRDIPLVNKGIFRFTSNGMYVYAFMLFWAIAFGFNSSAALAVAAFSHFYIWVHYIATEKPDMDYLYGSQKV